MAIRNTSGEVAGLSLASGLPTIQNMSASCLIRLRQAHADGEQMMLCARVGTSNWISLMTDVSSGNGMVRLYTGSAWEEISGSTYATNTWTAIGFSCGGVGTDLLRVMRSTASDATPAGYTRTLGGSTGTVTLFEAIHRTLFLDRGSHLDIQNLKVGAGFLSATQLHDEAWSTSVVHSGSWTPIHAPMTDGTLSFQASPFALVNESGLEVVTGPLAGGGGGSPSPLLIRRRLMGVSQ